MSEALKTLAIICLPALPTVLAMPFCPVSKGAGDVVKARPPPWVFGTVWPLLFLGMGVSLLRLDCKWPIMVTAVILALWQIVYSPRCGGNKTLACWILLLCTAAAIAALSFAVCESDAVSIACLSALVGWLIFAQLLNVLEVQLS
jgi:tryptophan-rich sensory protein